MKKFYLLLLFIFLLIHQTVFGMYIVNIKVIDNITGQTEGITGFKVLVEFPNNFNCENCKYLWDLDDNGKIDKILYSINTGTIDFMNANPLEGTLKVYILDSNEKCIGVGKYNYKLSGDLLPKTPDDYKFVNDFITRNPKSDITIPNYCNLPETKEECENIDGYWYQGQCYQKPFCNPEHLELCKTEEECVNDGNGIWFNNVCYSEPLCDKNDLQTCNDKLSCSFANGIWLGNSCYKPQQQFDNWNFIFSNKLYRILTIVSTFNYQGYKFMWPYFLIEAKDFNPENYGFYIKFKEKSHKMDYIKYFTNLPDRYYNIYFFGYALKPEGSFNPSNFTGIYDFYIVDEQNKKILFHRSVNVDSTTQIIQLNLPQSITVSNEDIPEISWSSVDNADLYLIKIYRFDPEKNKPDTNSPYYGSDYIFDTKFDLKSIKSINLPPGKYFVRIQPVAYTNTSEKYGLRCETKTIGTSVIFKLIELKKPLLSNGWYLLGAPIDLKVSLLDKNYQNTDKTIWKWEDNNWKVYSNDAAIKQLINNYGIPSFTEIKKGEGYWVQIKN